MAKPVLGPCLRYKTPHRGIALLPGRLQIGGLLAIFPPVRLFIPLMPKFPGNGPTPGGVGWSRQLLVLHMPWQMQITKHDPLSATCDRRGLVADDVESAEGGAAASREGEEEAEGRFLASHSR